MTTQTAAAEYLGIDPQAVISGRIVNGSYRIMWDEGVKGVKVQEIPLSLLAPVPVKSTPPPASNDPAVDLSSLKVKELRELAKELKITIPKGAKKAAIIKLLQANN